MAGRAAAATASGAAQGLADGGEPTGDDAPPGSLIALVAFDEPGPGQDPGVVGDGGLALAQRLFQVAAAHLALLGDQGDQPVAARRGARRSTR